MGNISHDSRKANESVECLPIDIYPIFSATSIFYPYDGCELKNDVIIICIYSETQDRCFIFKDGLLETSSGYSSWVAHYWCEILIFKVKVRCVRYSLWMSSSFYEVYFHNIVFTLEHIFFYSNYILSKISIFSSSYFII